MSVFPDESKGVRAALSGRVTLALGTIVLASTVLAILLLSREQGWGDDFAAYIMQARSLASGGVDQHVKLSSFIIQNSSYWYVPVTYPWGFPLLLAPVVGVFGIKILALKLVLTACYGFFLTVYFLFARRRLQDREALLLTAVLGFNPALLGAQNEILADIPCLLFSMLALWLIDAMQNSSSEASPGVSIATGSAIFMSAFIRSTALVLVVPLAVVHAIKLYRYARKPGYFRGQLPGMAIPYATLALLYAIQGLALPSSPYDALGIFGSTTFASIVDSIRYYFWLPAELFGHLGWAARLVYMLVLLGFLVQLLRAKEYDLHLHLFGLALLLPYILMPAVQGIRYIYPVLPIMLVLSYQGLKSVPARIARWNTPSFLRVVAALWVALAMVSLGAATARADRNLRSGRYPHGRSDGAYSPAADAMFEFVRKHTPADSVVMFFRPRAMALRTNRLAFQSPDCRRLPQADYVVLANNNPPTDQIPRGDVERCNPAVVLTAVYEKDEFAVFEISPAG